MIVFTSEEREVVKEIESRFKDIGTRFGIRVGERADINKHTYVGLWCSHGWYEVEGVTIEHELEQEELDELTGIINSMRRILVAHSNLDDQLRMFNALCHKLYGENRDPRTPYSV